MFFIRIKKLMYIHDSNHTNPWLESWNFGFHMNLLLDTRLEWGNVMTRIMSKIHSLISIFYHKRIESWTKLDIGVLTMQVHPLVSAKEISIASSRYSIQQLHPILVLERNSSIVYENQFMIWVLIPMIFMISYSISDLLVHNLLRSLYQEHSESNTEICRIW